jgi:hypothetical protein
MKKILSIILVLVVVLSLTACASKSNSGVAMDSIEMTPQFNSALGNMFADPDSSVDINASYDKSESSTGNNTSIGNSEETVGEYLERKIVYTVIADLQTKDFDAAIQLINDGIETNGAYIQSQKQTDSSGINSKYSDRNITMVVRVPSENLDAFITGLQNENIHTLSISKDSKDYSTTYYDKEVRINSLKIQEERLLNMLSQSSDLQTLLDLEDRLSDIRYEIESLTKEMNIIDSNVDYSTVTIYMSEVVKYNEVTEEPATFFERIVEAVSDTGSRFVENAQDFAIWLIHAMPTLIILGIFALVVVSVIKRKIKKKKIDKQSAETPAN